MILAVVALGRDIFDQVDKFKEIAATEYQAQKLAQDNNALKEKLKEAGSSYALEKQAREKLGYQRPGDVLYVVELGDKESEEREKTKENWRQWYDFLLN